MNNYNIQSTNDKAVLTAEIYIEAQRFFSEAGVHFISSEKERRYGFNIILDPHYLGKAIIISPFTYVMNIEVLAHLYVNLVNDERFGGPRRIQRLIKTAGDVIKAGFAKGSSLSHDLETGKDVLMPVEVLKIFSKIFTAAISHSTGGEDISHLGDIYTLLGGYTGTFMFLREVLVATHASIPTFEDRSPIPAIGDIRPLRCYTCKYCNTQKDGKRTCTKRPQPLDSSRYSANPGRYPDARHNKTWDGLVSAVIDDRMYKCDDYKIRK